MRKEDYAGPAIEAPDYQPTCHGADFISMARIFLQLPRDYSGKLPEGFAERVARAEAAAELVRKKAAEVPEAVRQLRSQRSAESRRRRKAAAAGIEAGAAPAP